MNTTATPAQRLALEIGGTDQVLYRRVRLRCGPHVLSEADNWYVPSRLEDEMNRRLETSEDTVGRVVQGLNVTPRTNAAQVLWKPAAMPRDVPVTILRHEAVLLLADGMPFSVLVDNYRRELLGLSTSSA